MALQDQSLTGAGPASARIVALDALRGFAVLGIFIINIIGFSMPGLAFNYPTAAGGDGALNYGLWTFTEIFVEGSMRGLFSLMFGAGLILFTERALYPDGPIRVADLYYRRTLWLIIFGLINTFVLLMPGDILLIYGMAGLLLFPFRILPARRLALAAGVIACLFMAHDAFIVELPETREGLLAEELIVRAEAGEDLSEEDQDTVDAWNKKLDRVRNPDEAVQQDIADRTGDILTVFRTNAEWSDFSTEGLSWWVVDALMMMLLGMAFYKWRIVTGERSAGFYALMAIAGYAVGGALRAWAVWERWDSDFSPLLWASWIPLQPARIAVTIGHVGLFFVLWKMFAASWLFRALAATGRMALTNYAAQTVVANLIFSGVGLGLYGALDRAQVYLVMIAVWIVQLAASLWWLGRFRFGPLEWGWRCLTYWRRQPFRKAASVADNAALV